MSAPEQNAAPPASGPSTVPATQATAVPPPPPPGAGQFEYSGLNFNGIESAQLLKLLRSLPQVFGSLDPANANPKQDAASTQVAQTLSTLAQYPGTPALPYAPPPGMPGINDPGPSSHPRGPPNLGQLSAVALQSVPALQQPGQPQAQQEISKTPLAPVAAATPAMAADAVNAHASSSSSDGQEASPSNSANATSSGGRRGRNPAIGTDEWTRQRKDNHKEVERRRRGNINDGINELGRIVPNGTGEKAKGAILSRAVQYIHHLKENEARNIEKWTLEKLLMDQAMGDLQAQLEEVKRLWDEERTARQRLETELEVLRGRQGGAKEETAGVKRRSEGEATEPSGTAAPADAERDGKRQRVE